MNKKICIISGSRADFGLIKPLLNQIKTSGNFILQFIATGSHLSPEFGLTYKEIQSDGFDITEKIEVLLNSDTTRGICKSMGLVLISFAEAYSRQKPDIIVVLGDRYEIFSAVAAAHVSRIPVAHISGGEVTEGAMDDAFRHSITKMSHLHFTATEKYRRRVIQLGENPGRVFNVGEIGLEGIKNIRLLPKNELENEFGFKFNKYIFSITFHSVTLEENTSGKQFKNLLSALEEQKDTSLIFTKTNADTDGRIINKMIDDFVLKYPEKSISFTSLGRLKYLSLLRFVDAVIGNSSSGIVEAPSFKIGTINIGDRQKGRVKAQSVIDCEPTKESIKIALDKLHSRRFQKKLELVKNPYENDKSYCGSQIILEIISSFLKNEKSIKKDFFDLDFNHFEQ